MTRDIELQLGESIVWQIESGRTYGREHCMWFNFADKSGSILIYNAFEHIMIVTGIEQVNNHLRYVYKLQLLDPTVGALKCDVRLEDDGTIRMDDGYPTIKRLRDLL